ncbi:hypothetical protein FQA39_LY19011 [Lamprigera yunnana]|nr:hypothetical protein FQA39_LY19011 [Lamprigera yunnana]
MAVILRAFDIELFLDKEGKSVGKRNPPRLHNSDTEQKEIPTRSLNKLIALVKTLPLAIRMLLLTAMLNLVGARGYSETVYRRKDDVLKIPELTFTYMGKTETKPGRKMDTFNVFADSREELMEKLVVVKEWSIENNVARNFWAIFQTLKGLEESVPYEHFQESSPHISKLLKEAVLHDIPYFNIILTSNHYKDNRKEGENPFSSSQP